MNLRVPLTSLSAWIFSMALHASGLCVAILLAAEFSVVPRVAPFRWDVTLMAASPPIPFSSNSPSPAVTASPEMTPDFDDLSRSAASSTVKQRPDPARAIMATNVPAKDIPNHHALRSHISKEAVAPAAEPTHSPTSQAESPPPEHTGENSTSTGMVWPMHTAISDDRPPPVIETADQSAMAMEPSVPEVERVMNRPSPQFRPTPVSRHLLADYGWLAGLVATEVEHIKRYPAQAKWHRWQGNVVVQAVIHEDGRISDIQVLESSGHETLDHDAVALLDRISPMQLPYPLDQSTIVVRIPIGYRLE